jgi:hypothetical protein
MKFPWVARSILLRLVKATGAACPECGAAVAFPESVEGLEPERVLRCAGCGRHASLAEIALRSRSASVGGPDVSEPPEGTRIVKRA